MKSPFKFLDPYGPGDRNVFFGRDEEIEQLYQRVSGSSLVLVYGPSGVGKTSLIDCGLASRYQPSDWLPIPVRRQDNINADLARAIDDRVTTRLAGDTTPVEAIQSLYLDHLRPIVLILDQFEELFIVGSEDEQRRFTETVTNLLAADISCKIVICLREDAMHLLHRFEKAVPTLHDKRLRLEPMRMSSVLTVIVRTAAAFDIGLEHGDATAQKIADNLNEGGIGVELTGLQLYLDDLWQEAAAKDRESPVVFTDAAIEETGKLQNMIQDFLEREERAIQGKLVAKDNEATQTWAQRGKQWLYLDDAIEDADKQAVRRVLERFVTSDGTKRPRTRNELAEQLKSIEPWLDDILFGLHQARIVRCCEGLFELAHDILARSIANRRGIERRMVIQTERLVRDQMDLFELKKKYLGSGDLALVRQYRDELQLTDKEEAFVKESKVKLRWRRLGWVTGSGCLFILSIPGIIFLYIIIFEGLLS